MLRYSSLLFLLIVMNGFSQEPTTYSEAELIGKGNPTFYGDGYKLQKEAYTAFEKMRKAALADGIKIRVVSSYRGFEHQKGIWTRKYNRFTKQGMSPQEAIAKIIEYSTIPGTSRHHWGTDIDIVDGGVPQPKSVLEPDHFSKGKVFYIFKEWMDVNANKFGFYLVYTAKEGRKGFKYEPWHFSYKPISKEMLKQYKSIDIKAMLQKEKIVGSEHFSDAFIQMYRNENILDINPELK